MLELRGESVAVNDQQEDAISKKKKSIIELPESVELS
jgi:hypothetical protein